MITYAEKTQASKSQSAANESAQKLDGSASTFQFIDTRPEVVAQRKLQKMVNNSPQVSQRKAFEETTNNSLKAEQADSVIQRMVLPVWATEEDKVAFLDQGKQQSEKMGHGKVINIGNFFTDKNLSGIGEYEDLHIIGHGNPASVAGMSPTILANYICNTLKLPPKYKGRIFLETCNSGTKIEQLEGTYAERFIIALNSLRGEETEQLTAVGFAGNVVLDTGFPKRETLRVLKEGITIDDFKERSVIFINDTGKIMEGFINELKEKDLLLYMKDEDIGDLYFHIYNTKISQIAEPQDGKLTKLYVDGTEYTSIPEQIPDIGKMMDDIVSSCQAKKDEIDNIPVLKFEDL